MAGGMNLRDLIIIYLACGAPFGVYYFLQNRQRTEAKVLLLKSVLRFVFWIPFALRMVARKSLFTNLYNRNFDNRGVLDAKNELRIEEIKKFFESLLIETAFSISIYEFREIFDRYVGLCAEIHLEKGVVSDAEQELYRITNHPHKKVGEICMNRRNRLRLSFHQKLARRDFLEIIGKLSEKLADPQNLLKKATELAEIVRDTEASQMFENLSKESQQTRQETSVKILEQELWKPEKHKPFTDSQISTNMQVLAATAKLSRKD